MAKRRCEFWNVPWRRDPRFVGRDMEMGALASALAATGRSALTQPASIHGLGGVGKTQLAVEFAYRHEGDYDAVLWLSAEEPATLASAFGSLARTLELPAADETDQNKRTAAVLDWLEAHDRWLLVFDNAKGPEPIEPYIPRRVTGHVVITSRNPDWKRLARPVKVHTLPRPDAIQVLRGDPPQGDAAEAGQLAEALGDLPLALAQAAAFLRETGRSFTEYRERFLSLEAEFEGEQAEPGYGRTVAATLELALSALGHGDGPANSPADVLARCAFYAPDRIPRELLAADFPDVGRFDTAIRELRRYSLIETEGGSLSVHRLVQRAVRMRMSVRERVEYAGHAAVVIAARFPRRSQDVRYWLACEPLLSHAIHVGQYALECGSPTAPIAELLGSVGVLLRVKANLRQAKEHFLQALNLTESAYGPRDRRVAIALSDLGLVTRTQGDFVEARRYLEQAVHLLEEVYGPDHPEVGNALGDLGTVAKDQGELPEARRCQERALHIFEAIAGTEYKSNIASALNNLGLVARRQGDMANARRYLSRALPLMEAVYGTNHPEVAAVHNNIGIVARDQGDFIEARRHLELALRLKEEAFGAEHPDVALTLANLGLEARDQGNRVKARQYLERALAIFRKFYGEEHPQTIRTIDKLRSLDEPSPSLTGNLAVQSTDRKEMVHTEGLNSVPPTPSCEGLSAMCPCDSEPVRLSGSSDVPRVFLSYSHDSAEHADCVLALADALCGHGIDVILDRYVHPAPAEGWPRWMDLRIDEARFVLLVSTETYRRRVMGKEEPGKGLGVRWEGNLIYNRIYHDAPAGSRFIPILLPGCEPSHIPNPLQGHQFYRITKFDLTDPGFEALYRHLTNQPATPKPNIGSLVVLQSRPRPDPSGQPAVEQAHRNHPR